MSVLKLLTFCLRDLVQYNMIFSLVNLINGQLSVMSNITAEFNKSFRSQNVQYAMLCKTDTTQASSYVLFFHFAAEFRRFMYTYFCFFLFTLQSAGSLIITGYSQFYKFASTYITLSLFTRKVGYIKRRAFLLELRTNKDEIALRNNNRIL